jgi:starvation-inducible outer membrane lipoprotein
MKVLIVLFLITLAGCVAKPKIMKDCQNTSVEGLYICKDF